MNDEIFVDGYLNNCVTRSHWTEIFPSFLSLERRTTISKTMAVVLSELPVEVLHQIISHLPPSTVPTLQIVSRKFNTLPQPLLWRHHCLSHFKHWNAEQDVESRLSKGVLDTDWKKMFADRYTIDRSIARDVGGILASQRNRIEKAERIMGHGYDAKDMLLRNLNVDDEAEDVLARRSC